MFHVEAREDRTSPPGDRIDKKKITAICVIHSIYSCIYDPSQLSLPLRLQILSSLAAVHDTAMTITAHTPLAILGAIQLAIRSEQLSELPHVNLQYDGAPCKLPRHTRTNE